MVPVSTLLRRLIPFVLLKGIVIPFATFLVLVGYGRDEAERFWKYCF